MHRQLQTIPKFYSFHESFFFLSSIAKKYALSQVLHNCILKLSHGMRNPAFRGLKPAKSQMSRLMTKPTKSQQRLRSAWASAQSDQSSLCTQRLCSDWTDAQADLSLRWAHIHFVGFVMSWLK